MTDTQPAGLSGFETIRAESGPDHVLVVTLDRPERMNAFNSTMCEEFAAVWDYAANEDAVHCVVLQADGDRAFSTGVDVSDRPHRSTNLWTVRDPGEMLSPKQRGLWKPVVTAVHGMAAGGAFYWINESDIVICSDDAQFFDPHVTYGMTAALEPIGMARTIALREVLRLTLLGMHERLSAGRALEIGLVSEVVSRERLRPRARELAAIIAGQPPVAVQGSVKAIWQSLDMTRSQALATAMSFVQLGNPIGESQVDRATMPRPDWTLR